uniref:Uncharacterized protein n=1 Tax=viral metagenome TaxID=1070528 RepID=A0A6H2A4R1_9ZZZZ
MPLNPDPDQNGYTLDEIEGFRRITSRRRKRLKVLLENARKSMEADFGDDCDNH